MVTADGDTGRTHRSAAAQLLTELTICIADVSVRAASGRPDVLLQLDHPDERFLAPSPQPDYELQVSVGATPKRVPGEVLFESGTTWRLSADGDTLYFEFYTRPGNGGSLRVLKLDARTKRGELTVAPIEHGGLRVRKGGYTVLPFYYPLLQLLVQWELAQVGGISCHAAGVTLDGRGCIFLGVSGAGKTTLSRLCLDAGATVLSDDRVGIRSHEGGFRIYGTPWRGTPELASPDSAPLHAAFFIEHGAENEATPMTPAAACAQLIARGFPPYFSRELMARALETCAGITESAPCYRLRFRPDESVVDILRATLTP